MMSDFRESGMAETPETKGQRTFEKAIRSAIHCLANLGYDQTTFQAIADHAGLSQPLVVHYFKKKENVFPQVIDYLLAKNAQLGRPGAMKLSAREELRTYLKEAIRIFRENPDSSKIYFTLSFMAVFKESYRISNTKLKQANLERLINILAHGIHTGEFSPDALIGKARMINNLLAGTFMDILTETSSMSDDEILMMLEECCLGLLARR
jgi:AcrR family transcriptional regulator